MADKFVHLLVRPLVAWWLMASAHSWRRAVVAADSPHVHAPGTDPDRILITGDGASTGRGVLTHDLGLPGYLARNLTLLTGRATDVDIVVTAEMTAATSLLAIADLNLSRFDAILLSLGANEALNLTPVARWRRDITRLLDRIKDGTGEETGTVVLSIPFFAINPHFPRILARVVDRHVQQLNAATQDLLTSRPHARFVLFTHGDTYEPDGAHAYERWAKNIAPKVAELLDAPSMHGTRTEVPDEIGRQHALTRLTPLTRDTDHAITALTETAKRVFGTSIAAVTLIDTDTQRMPAATGMEPVTLPREESLCDMTIRRATHFVIEDTTLDSRYAHYSVVTESPGVRFYAGYPIESPDGYRIGALCIMDTKPRHFTPDDTQLLRQLAQQAQTILWKSHTPSQ
ncbi:hypothetical protein AX769_21110 (plasmid) [Frondihabitans sp. PAMC 28766]|uniref:GAF domain-containing protein n=1 Tax=Frondihabitans sp. PAMC 28766 TaxID=1795630 RepID=UPI00078C70BA|nr:GAF domain-containing protein [Frondihabitans sp. PAMC 28766]AMM22640.1 hypothetical protein AX769_21110 [Frondihabitans sp. PAMC 28766]